MNCKICKRALKAEPWRSRGIGPICSKKQALELDQRDPETGDIIDEYDGGDIYIERLAAQTRNASGNLEWLKHTASGVRTNVRPIDMKKSPSGFNFGYGGSGPSCFALNTLLMFCEVEADAYRLFQDFKWKYVAGDNKEERLVIPRAEILEFLETNGATVIGKN